MTKAQELVIVAIARQIVPDAELEDDGIVFNGSLTWDVWCSEIGTSYGFVQYRGGNQPLPMVKVPLPKELEGVNP